MDLDGWQWVVFILVVGEMTVFTVYLFVQEVERQAMISDTLTTEDAYLGSLTAFMTVRELTVLSFGVRYRGEASCKAWLGVGGAGLVLGLAGWTWLVTHLDDWNHYSGVGLFSLGTFLYDLAMIQLARVSDPHLRSVHDSLAVTLYVISAALGALFLALWAVGNERAYIVEHMVYLNQVMFHGWFFLFHSPDPARAIEHYDDYAEPAVKYSGAEPCRPLLTRGINGFL